MILRICWVWGKLKLRLKPRSSFWTIVLDCCSPDEKLFLVNDVWFFRLSRKKGVMPRYGFFFCSDLSFWFNLEILFLFIYWYFSLNLLGFRSNLELLGFFFFFFDIFLLCFYLWVLFLIDGKWKGVVVLSKR